MEEVKKLDEVILTEEDLIKIINEITGDVQK